MSSKTSMKKSIAKNSVRMDKSMKAYEKDQINDRLIDIWCKRNGDFMNGLCFACDHKLHLRDFLCDYASKMDLNTLEPLCLSCMKGLKSYTDSSDSDSKPKLKYANYEDDYTTSDEARQVKSNKIEKRLLKEAREQDMKEIRRKVVRSIMFNKY